MGAMRLQYSKVVVMIGINQLKYSKVSFWIDLPSSLHIKPIGNEEDILADMYLKCNVSLFT
jgi:hypothetical protein